MAALLLVLLIGIVFNADGAFFKVGTHRDTLRQASVYGILACGMTLVIIAGGIDLSVGSVLALDFGDVLAHHNSLRLVALAVDSYQPGAGGRMRRRQRHTCGEFPHSAVHRNAGDDGFCPRPGQDILGRRKNLNGRPHPRRRVSLCQRPGDFSAINARVMGGNVAVVTLILLGCAVAAWVMLARHRWGRQLYAIGGNEEAARLSGVPVRTATVLAYAACGLLAGVAGICQAAQEQQGDPEAGMGYELTAIAMVVVGGTALTGGRGGMVLTLLGVLTIGYLDKILSINAVSEAGRLMLTGGIIVIAVLAQGRRRT